jgi:hypothetical protein
MACDSLGAVIVVPPDDHTDSFHFEKVRTARSQSAVDPGGSATSIAIAPGVGVQV